MTKTYFGVASVLALAIAAPANAATDICSGRDQQCALPQTDANILLTSGTNLTEVQGSFNGGGASAAGVFTSTSDRLNADASTQATISSAVDARLNNLTFSLLNGSTFMTATFNLFTGQISGIPVTITGFNANGTQITESFTLVNGSNNFGLVGTGGDRFTALSLSSTIGVPDFRQLRLGGVNQVAAPVPEPGTWALMLIGFGAVGLALRRTRPVRIIRAA